jgi:hypothetical protein
VTIRIQPVPRSDPRPRRAPEPPPSPACGPDHLPPFCPACGAELVGFDGPEELMCPACPIPFELSPNPTGDR